MLYHYINGTCGSECRFVRSSSERMHTHVRSA